MFVTAVSEHLASASSCLQMKTFSIAPPFLVESLAALVAIPHFGLLLHPFGIGWKVFGKLVCRDSRSCCSRSTRICLMRFGASSSATGWSFEVGYLWQLGLLHLQGRYLSLYQIFEICEWSVSNFLFLQSFSQHGPKDFE